VLLDWGVGSPTEDGYALDPNLLKVKTSLGEPPFTLNCVELKDSLSLDSFRQDFFQCLSNSRWAHRSTFAIAQGVDDELLLKELERLGTSYEVSIITFGLSPDSLSALPNAAVIRDMPDDKFEGEIVPKLSIKQITTGRDRTALDWETIKDLQSQSPDFPEMFEWIAYCLDEKKAYTFDDFKKIKNIKRKA
jgi:hypothetical protein